MSDSKSAQIFCDTCSDLTIFVNETESVSVTCQSSSSCDHITTHIANQYYTPSPTVDPVALTEPIEIITKHSLFSYLIPHCKFSWDCEDDGCINNTNSIIIDTMDESHIQCNIHQSGDSNTNHSTTWFCDEHILSPSNFNFSQCSSPSKSKTTQIIATDPNDGELSDPSTTKLIGDKKDSSERSDSIIDRENFWAEFSSILLGSCLVICCCVCCIVLCVTKRNIEREKKKSMDTSNRKVPRKRSIHSKNNNESSREDTVGSTVEDTIKESLSMKNPHEVGIDGLIEVLDNTRTGIGANGQTVPTPLPIERGQSRSRGVSPYPIDRKISRNSSIGVIYHQDSDPMAVAQRKPLPPMNGMGSEVITRQISPTWTDDGKDEEKAIELVRLFV